MYIWSHTAHVYRAPPHHTWFLPLTSGSSPSHLVPPTHIWLLPSAHHLLILTLSRLPSMLQYFRGGHGHHQREGGSMGVVISVSHGWGSVMIIVGLGTIPLSLFLRFGLCTGWFDQVIKGLGTSNVKVHERRHDICTHTYTSCVSHM